MRAERIEAAQEIRLAEADDLALVGEIAMLIDPADLIGSTDAALERLRRATHAAACELLLAGADGLELFLICHVGEDLEAFCQRDRFAVGEGFPGIVLQAATSLFTESLGTEADFVRSRVKALDYWGLMCAPVWCCRQIGGCLLLAWKQRSADLQRARRVTTLAARAIGTALEAARTEIRVAGVQEAMQGASWLSAVAERLRTVSHADTAGFAVLPPAPAGTTASDRAGPRHAVESSATTLAFPPACPARLAQRVQVLGGREGWPRYCLEAGCRAKLRYCIPVISNGQTWALATVAFRERAPAPRTKWLPPALWLAQELAPPPTLPRDGGQLAVQVSVQPRLRIRCFGGFDVWRDGRRVGLSELKRRKARELLALFVVASGRPTSGERLAEQLWPGAEQHRARNRFHVTLSALRDGIEPGSGRPWLYLRREAEGQRYFLDRSAPVDVDLWRFYDLLRQARSAEAQMRPLEEVVALLRETTALYRGELFDGAFTAECCTAMAARCRADALDACRRLARLQYELGDRAGARATLRCAAESEQALRALDRSFD